MSLVFVGSNPGVTRKKTKKTQQIQSSEEDNVLKLVWKMETSYKWR